MKTIKTLWMMAAAVVVAFVAQARSIALWPVEYDSTLTTFDGASVILPGDDLSIYTDDTTVSGIAAGVGWNLPPNLGEDKFLFDPINHTAITGTLGVSTDAKGMTMRCTSANVVNHLYPTNDFTLEGWFTMTEYKTDNWVVFMQQGLGSGDKSGWFIAFLFSESRKWFRLTAAGGDVAFNDLTAEETVALTNGWRHFALTFQFNASETTSAWTMYLDGVSKGTINRPKVTSVNNSHQAFEFGGRYNSKSNRFFGGFDYWRLSDEVLAPSQFLNAGGVGTVIPVPTHTISTVAYWKLGTNADGTLDGSDYVGSADLSDGLHDLPTTTSGFFSGMVPSSESAFSGNPPNPTITLSSPNSGSALSLSKTGSSDSAKNGTVLVVPDLGSELSFANDFTVEGWIKPRWKTGTAGVGYLFGTRFDGNGWVLGVNASNQAYIYAQDGSGTFHNSAVICTMPANWLEKWTHIALVYSATTGNGTWSLYADGALLGTLVNSRASTASNTSFRIGGRETRDWTFNGNYDCFRVSKTALSPSQFLCTANGTAASNVLALWPLDTPDGVSWNLRDEIGNYTLRALRSANYRPVVDASSAPTVTNPDTSANFNGCAASTRGSVAFGSADGTERTRSFLATSDPSVITAISSKNGFTIEGYFKRAAAAVGDEYLFIAPKMTPFDTTIPQISFIYSSNGFYIYDTKFSNFGPSASGSFSGTGDQPIGEWRHFALTYQGVETKNANNQTVLTSTWKLYINGSLSGTLSRATLGAVDSANPRWFAIGSRPSNGNAFRGSLSSVRISNTALEPGQFLCDAGTLPVPTVPETLAYWPLDSADGASFDLAAKTDPIGYSFYYYAAAAVGGSAERAIGSLPGGVDVSLSRANTGSVTLTGGSSDYMRTAYLGRRLALDKDFTVEGWFKWNAATRGRRNVLAGTYDAGKHKGWRLEIDDTGDAPRFRVFARAGENCSPLVDSVFAGRVLGNIGAWQHVALSYNPHAGHGTWTLRLDGQDAGTVENDWRDDSLLGTSDTFVLGNYCDTLVGGFGGTYDMWRVSKGSVATENLIWRPRGMTIIVR